MSFMAGAAKREIAIPERYLGAENFGQIHDALHVRAVVLKQEEMYAILSFELTSLMGDVVAEFKRVVHEKTGIREDHIWICTTHSFSSPHLMPDHMLGSAEKIALKETYRVNLIEAMTSAVCEAKEKLQNAVMKVGTSQCDIVANRDVELADGWWIGTCGDGPTDRTVTAITLENAAGEKIAVIAHFAMQSSVMDQAELEDGKKPVTSDIAGMTCNFAEEKLGGVVLYLIGAAGDQSPVEKAVEDTFEGGKRIRTDLGAKGFEICEWLSTKLAAAVAEAALNAEESGDYGLLQKAKTIHVPAQKMKGNVHTLVPTHSYEYEADGEREMEIEVLKIGDTALLGVKPELNFVTAKSIRENAGKKYTLVCTMVNGAAKYMADEGSYDRFCYEAMNSPWNKGAAEILCKEGIRLLKEI